MNPATLIFQEAIIRALRGLLTAWEKWLEAKKLPA